MSEIEIKDKNFNYSESTTIVLINCESGCENAIIEDLRKLEEVKIATLIFGAYNIIVFVSTSKIDEMEKVINWKIKKIAKIRSTLTFLTN